MAQRASTPSGAPCWADLMTSDPDGAEHFYGHLFGWTAKRAGEEYGGYITFVCKGQGVAGAMSNGPECGQPDGWSVYLATGDVAATADAAAAHGGSVLVAPMRIGELGSMAVIRDVAGSAVGAWQPGAHTGFGLVGEAGAPVWFELRTRDYDAAVRFYADVFDWEPHDLSDSEDFRYTTLGENGSGMAGIMDAASLPRDAVLGWNIYFGVEDADAALAAVESLGGAVVEQPEDTPHGRLAKAADVTGAEFHIAGPTNAQ